MLVLSHTNEIQQCLNTSLILKLRFILYSWFRASYFYINKFQQDATVCRYLFTAKSVSTYFGCPSHPSSGEHKTVTAASGTGHSVWATTFCQRGRIIIRPRWRKAAVRVLYSADDGCDGHPKRVESDFAVNKYLHTVASFWILLM